MSNLSPEILSAILEIRDLVRVLAEPAIAERDNKLRSSLREIVGASPKKKTAVLLMNGTRNQAAIHRESGLGAGHLSELVKELSSNSLLAGELKTPKLAISIPLNFFDPEAGEHD